MEAGIIGLCAVTVPVVQVRVVRVPMHQGRMPMPVGVRLARTGSRAVLVLMVCIMMMSMLVFHRVVDMLVLMPLGQVQP